MLALYVTFEMDSGLVRKAVSQKAGKSKPKKLLGIPGNFISVRVIVYKNNLEGPNALGNESHSHSIHTHKF